MEYPSNSGRAPAHTGRAPAHTRFILGPPDHPVCFVFINLALKICLWDGKNAILGYIFGFIAMDIVLLEWLDGW